VAAKSRFATLQSGLYSRVAAASEWLRCTTQPSNGDGPNLGANDGARLLALTDTDYRDYRPSIQLASVLFHSASAFSGRGTGISRFTG